MKTILTITTFAIALMVVAFNTNPVMANTNIWGWEEAWDEYEEKVRTGVYKKAPIISELDEVDNEREVADSGEEGSTSEASDGVSARTAGEDAQDETARE